MSGFVSRYGKRCLCGYRYGVFGEVTERVDATLVVHAPHHCFTVFRDAVVPHPVKSRAAA